MFGRKLDARTAEIDVGFAVNRNEMDVNVRNFEAESNNSNSLTINGLPDTLGDFFGEHHHRAERVVIQIENVVELPIGGELRHHQSVSDNERIDVQKSEKPFVLSHLVTGNLAVDDARKNRCHNSIVSPIWG